MAEVKITGSLEVVSKPFGQFIMGKSNHSTNGKLENIFFVGLWNFDFIRTLKELEEHLFLKSWRVCTFLAFAIIRSR